MKRIVHLDLKGAPLKVPYLEKVLLVVKSWGATGILLEWEDTFPYTGDLEDIGSLNGKEGLYSQEEVRHIIDFIEENDLEAIQLVQTIGHLEFVLKHPKFKHLREIPKSPAVLCPSKNESRVLVKNMLKQALDMQPAAYYFHIGADEVWHMQVCDDCKLKAAASPYKAASLFLDHINDLTMFLKDLRPNLTILMWDDMLRGMTTETIKAYELCDIVQPVVWLYNPMDSFQIDRSIWRHYKQLFAQLWAGSAFKGANGSCQVLSPVERYVSNQEAWIDEIDKQHGKIDFAGIILTGWSRFDHYATLCELLPVSLPSLASCLKMLQSDPNTPKEEIVNEVLPSEEWPAEGLARCIHSFVILRDRVLAFLHGDMVTTWMNTWQIEHSYGSPAQAENIALSAQHMRKELTMLHIEISAHLTAITGVRSKEEWLGTFLNPILKRLTRLCNYAERRAQCDASVLP